MASIERLVQNSKLLKKVYVSLEGNNFKESNQCSSLLCDMRHFGASIAKVITNLPYYKFVFLICSNLNSISL